MDSLLNQNPPLSVIPAELSFLALYNPTYGTTDETFRDQIFFYHARKTSQEREVQNEEHEKERQIGLAQGMNRSFADKDIDHIDTEKSRIVIKEVEANWWIVAVKSSLANMKSEIYVGPGDGYESSVRDLNPPALLITQLINANRIFLLHNGPSLTKLLQRLERPKFCATLERFWSRFASRWNIILEGIPATDLLCGIKLAAGGELGVGVGEEEWGSGEREVLEDYCKRTSGLIDLLVARFGDPAPQVTKDEKKKGHQEPWMGSGQLTDAADGLVFSGVGKVARNSVKDIFEWTRWIHTYGDSAYGVRDSPSSDRRRKRRKASLPSRTKRNDDPVGGIPKSIINAADKSLSTATAKIERKESQPAPSTSSHSEDSWTKYLTFGYGTLWGVGDAEDTVSSSSLPPDAIKSRLAKLIEQENAGHFLIGLRGDPEDESDEVADMELSTSGLTQRMPIRTLHVITKPAPIHYPSKEAETRGITSASSKTPSRLRVIVYVHRPFIYTLLFNSDTASLSMPPFYRDLHTFLSALHPLLTRRTGATVAKQRIASQPGLFPPQIAGRPGVWAAVHDTDTLNTWSTLPSIPPPLASHQQPPNASIPSTAVPWSRADALATHNAALDILGNQHSEEVERSVKTGRGWWVVWARQRAETDSEESEVVVDESETSDGSGSEASTVKPRTGERQILIFKAPGKGDDGRTGTKGGSGWGIGIGGLFGGEKGKGRDDMGSGFEGRYLEGIGGLGR